MQHHVWGVVVAKVEASQVIQVASVTGLLLGQQTVFRAEARAILFVAEYQQTKMLDVTTDSQSVCKRLRKQRLCGTSMDLFERFEKPSASLTPFGSTVTWRNKSSKPNLVNKTIGDASSMPWWMRRLAKEPIRKGT